MGQKVNPIIMRIGINRFGDSRWYALKDYGDLLIEDITIRNYLLKTLAPAGIAKVIIERLAKKAIVTIYSARPGVIIGKKGADIEKIKQSIQKMTKSEITLNIVEVRKPELDAFLVASSICRQIESRVSYRRAMKRSMQTTLKTGALGVKVIISGRLGGTEIARFEESQEGPVPSHTLRADIDYGYATASTSYGSIGVKVWIYKGLILGRDLLTTVMRAGQNARTSITHNPAVM